MSLLPQSNYIHVKLVGGPYHGNIAVVHKEALQTKFPVIGKMPKTERGAYWLYVKDTDGQFHFEAEEVG